MKLSGAISMACTVQWVSSTAVAISIPTPSVTVTLSQSENIIIASIANNGGSALKLLSLGNILDERDVEKISVSSGGVVVPSSGLLIDSYLDKLHESAFTILEPGQQKNVRVNPAELHDMSEGGDYDLIARGTIPLADLSSTTLNGQSVSYKSNILTLKVDGQQAAATFTAYRSKQKRTHVAATCDLEMIRDALSACKVLSEAGSVSAREGTHLDKFYTYFGVNDQGTRDTVASYFDKIAEICGAGPSDAPIPLIHCGDYQGEWCEENTAAYVIVPERRIMSLCPGFENDPKLSTECFGYDQAGILLHEFAHLETVISPGTSDEGYGEKDTAQLPTERALRNPDSYRLYAHTVLLNCNIGPENQRAPPAQI